MKRLALLGLALAALAFARDTGAQVTPFKETFVAVDAVTLKFKSLVVTGVLQGDPAPVVRTYLFNAVDQVTATLAAQGCEKLALLLLTKPGQYLLEMTATTGYPDCKLSLVSP